MSLAIRPYHPSDLPALYRVCLGTGDSGRDAAHLYHDPELLAHYYVGPYLISEPDLASVLTQNGRPIGYAIATRDTAAFGHWCETEWFPVLRSRYPLEGRDHKSPAEQQLIQAIHRGHETQNRWPSYPAHLHIDLLPAGQGRGWGRRLMERLWGQLVELGVPGVHLGVGRGNSNAIDFYQHIGFEALEVHGWGFILGKNLG